MTGARILGLLMLALAGAVGAKDAGDSVYALQAPLVNQDGKAVPFDLYRGQPVVISMFYASCGYVCPTLIDNIRQVEGQLGEPARGRLKVLMVSIDPEHDTPAVLAELAAKHHADLSRWTFARAGAHDVRKIAALLGIEYRKLPDGGFNHSVLVTLLDGNGRILARSAKLRGATPEFAKALNEATAESQ